LNDIFEKKLVLRDIFVDSFYDDTIEHQKKLGLGFKYQNESSIRLGTRGFFHGLPCNSYADLSVMKQISGSPWKKDGSFNPSTREIF